MIRIAIDGPGGAGKSSVAKAVAKELGIIYVDTGALYRTIGLYMLNSGIDPKNKADVIANLNAFTLELSFIDDKQVILLNGNDVGDSIRAPEVSMAASDVSAIPEVREYLLKMQRDTATSSSVIMDGRDIGTVILPNAEVKIFLTASPEARATRRYNELISKGKDVTYEDVYNEMMERDKNDSTRDVAPCVQAKDAVLLDNSELDFEGTVKAIISIVNSKSKKKRSFYMRLHRIIAAPIRFFNRIKIHGRDNIPKEGPYIVCSNHIAAKDVFLIGASCPRQLHFLSKKELFSIPVVGWFLRMMGAVKLDRGGNDVGAIRKSIEILYDGGILAVFPQGHRYPGVDPSTTEVKGGAALIAGRAKCGIIPVFIKTKNNKYRIFRRIDIIFGKPIEYNELGFDTGERKSYDAITSLIFSRVLELGGYNALPSPQTTQSEE